MVDLDAEVAALSAAAAGQPDAVQVWSPSMFRRSMISHTDTGAPTPPPLPHTPPLMAHHHLRADPTRDEM